MNNSNDRHQKYVPVDWQKTPRPTRLLVVRLRWLQLAAFGLLVLFFGGLSVVVLGSKRSLSARTLVVPLISCAVLGSVGFLLFRSRRKAARVFDASGMCRGDGKRFDWNDFEGIVFRTRKRTPSGPAFIWRIELAFADGETAWIIPRQVENIAEVVAYTDTLPRARLAHGTAATPDV